MNRQVKFSTKIVVLSLGLIVCFSALIAWMYPLFQEGLRESKFVRTRMLAQTAGGMVQHFVDLSRRKAMPVEEAQRKALAEEAVKTLRYGKDDYFWVNDLQPRMLMHPFKPDLDGKDLSGFADPNGKKLFNEMVAVCKSAGEGFVAYEWPKPGAAKPVPKISYVKLFPDWGWIVGTGIYMDDLAGSEAAFVAKIRTIFIAGGVLVGLALLLTFLTVRSISRPITRAIAGLREGAEQVSSAAGEVSSASQSLAAGSSEQAASIEETSASLEEMSSMTQTERGQRAAGQQPDGCGQAGGGRGQRVDGAADRVDGGDQHVRARRPPRSSRRSTRSPSRPTCWR